MQPLDSEAFCDMLSEQLRRLKDYLDNKVQTMKIEDAAFHSRSPLFDGKCGTSPHPTASAVHGVESFVEGLALPA